MIQRYEFEVCNEYASSCDAMRKDPDGDYVLYSDHEAALAHERQISDDVVKDLEIARTYNLELQEKLERRACHVVKLKEALQDLMDEQNGPPLIRHKDKWEAAMSTAREALKEG